MFVDIHMFAVQECTKLPCVNCAHHSCVFDEELGATPVFKVDVEVLHQSVVFFRKTCQMPQAVDVRNVACL